MNLASERKTILILETDPDFAEDMAAILKSDFLIRVITNPADLIQEEGSNRVDLLLAALDFPGFVQAACFEHAEDSLPLDRLLHRLIDEKTPVLILGSEGLNDQRLSRFESAGRYPDPNHLLALIMSLFGLMERT